MALTFFYLSIVRCMRCPLVIKVAESTNFKTWSYPSCYKCKLSPFHILLYDFLFRFSKKDIRNNCKIKLCICLKIQQEENTLGCKHIKVNVACFYMLYYDGKINPTLAEAWIDGLVEVKRSSKHACIVMAY